MAPWDQTGIFDCCVGGCSGDGFNNKNFASLAKIYNDPVMQVYYKAFCNQGELIDECMSTIDGSLSTDKKIYRRGRDLMVKREVQASICYRRVATLIIDEYGLLNDFENIDSDPDLNLGVTKFTCDELKSIANQLNS